MNVNNTNDMLGGIWIRISNVLARNKQGYMYVLQCIKCKNEEIQILVLGRN